MTNPNTMEQNSKKLGYNGVFGLDRYDGLTDWVP